MELYRWKRAERSEKMGYDEGPSEAGNARISQDHPPARFARKLSYASVVQGRRTPAGPSSYMHICFKSQHREKLYLDRETPMSTFEWPLIISTIIHSKSPTIIELFVCHFFLGGSPPRPLVARFVRVASCLGMLPRLPRLASLGPSYELSGLHGDSDKLGNKLQVKVDGA